ncbi:hypothetical protein [Desertivirga arenae]|uniref:hypothetical protein n=1 Tax=Desertivirga arenae TaxID=2810309 RepID=UPI001A9790D6|nr:hypothetical protein [Pedobacter sp. SYSU D00823]
MKKVILTLLVAATGFVSANAQDGVYRDQQGEYHYETRDQQVWVPEQRVGGIFGVGGRTIPGHYETRSQQVKVYNRYPNSPYGQGQKGWAGKHPHGMPPGQRKKMQQSYSPNYPDLNRDRDFDDYGVYDNRKGSKNRKKN